MQISSDKKEMDSALVAEEKEAFHNKHVQSIAADLQKWIWAICFTTYALKLETPTMYIFIASVKVFGAILAASTRMNYTLLYKLLPQSM